MFGEAREAASVPKKRSKTARKKRTREHVIADLSAHHVAGHILRCGFTAEHIIHDYGIDVFMTTYNDRDEILIGVRLHLDNGGVMSRAEFDQWATANAVSANGSKSRRTGKKVSSRC